MSAHFPTLSSIDNDRSVSAYHQEDCFVLSELADLGKVEPSRDLYPRTSLGMLACRRLVSRVPGFWKSLRRVPETQDHRLTT